MRQKRVKRNTYLQPPPPRRAVPPRPPVDVELLGPAAGELLADLVVLGRLRHRRALEGWKAVELDQLPALYLDENRVAGLREYGAVDGDWFAAAVPLDFVSEGAHDLSLRDGEGRELPLPGHRVVQVAPRRDGLVTAVDRLALPLTVQRAEWRARLRIEGRLHPLLHWFCGRRGVRSHLCVALIDVSSLPPGRHQLELLLDANPPYTCMLEKLPAPR